MKSLILALTLTFATVSFANQPSGTVEFQVEKATFATEHIAHPGEAHLFINYDENQVTLKVEQLFHCEAGEVCAQVMPVPVIITLPITSIENGNCGIRKVTAQIDDRPADGYLKNLVVEDSSEMSCQTLLRYQAKATYETEAADRIHGTTIHHVSKMLISPLVPNERAFDTFHFSEGTFAAGYPAIEKPISGTLQLSETAVKLNVKVGLACGAGQPCPRYLPRPIVSNLPIVTIERSSCGDKIVASSTPLSSVEGVVETIEIVDYRNATCERVIPHLVEVTYTLKVADRDLERKALLYFNR